jgi:penicillin-binding protein 1B
MAGVNRGQRGKKSKPAWRIYGWRVRTLAVAAFLLASFAGGFYLAQLYGDISALIAERSAALTSAIYSAPTVLHSGENIERIHLLDRLAHLSYSQTPTPDAPGEYSVRPGLIEIYTRGYQLGAIDHPATLVRVRLDGGRIAGVADAFGVAKESAQIEPEIIGRLLPGAPAERVEVSLADQKPYLVQGLVATEDRWFYYHPGVDPIRVVEAAVYDLRSHRLAQGASTITQQLARTFLDRYDRNFGRKFRELAVAIVVEIRLSKNQILERYINDVPMGAYQGMPIEGLPEAARYIFNKDLREVTPAEAATLIGMIQAPTLYDPRRHPITCLKRRNTVLAVMRAAGVIDDAGYRAAVATPLDVKQPPGLRRAPYFTDYVASFVRGIAGLHGNLAGLKVYTTLDSELQSEAADSVRANLENLEKRHPRLRRTSPREELESSMVVLDADSGAIRAMVGGRDYAASQFNRAAQAQRQPGSSFKPIVYLAALDPSRSPFSPPLTLASILPDRPMSFGTWTPVNYERTYQGQVTVAEALYESLNVPTAWVGSRLGPGRIVKTAHELGIHEHLPAVLPIAIGADETTLLELTGAYQVFAGGGIESSPFAVQDVVDAAGHVIFHHADQSQRVVEPAVAYLITGALEQVMRYGTGAAAQQMGVRFPTAGKTGTTQDYHDAYFIGYTPELVCGVWVGFDTPRSIGLTGAGAALPAWAHFMAEAAGPASPEFPEPSGITMATIDPQTGGLATASCPRAIALPFLLGTAPTNICPLHGGGIYASTPAASPVTPASSVRVPPPYAAPMPSAAPSPSSGSVLGAVGRFFSGIFH